MGAWDCANAEREVSAVTSGGETGGWGIGGYCEEERVGTERGRKMRETREDGGYGAREDSECPGIKQGVAPVAEAKGGVKLEGISPSRTAAVPGCVDGDVARLGLAHRSLCMR
jgi:hypothetical protein